jgi:hypothetical protein
MKTHHGDAEFHRNAIPGKVYTAFQTLFGFMLKQCRLSIFEHWMHIHVENSTSSLTIKKQDWRTIITASAAPWHATVLAFKRVIEAIKKEGIENMKDSNNIEFEMRVDLDLRESEPPYKVNDFDVLIKYESETPYINITRPRWVDYVRKQFAKNGGHFVREYQKHIRNKQRFFSYPKRYEIDSQETPTLTS